MNKLARAITKLTKSCDKRLVRLISYIHNRSEFKQYCHVGNTAQQCRLGLFQDSDFAGDLEDSKSTSGGTLCIFGSHTFPPRSWMCKKNKLQFLMVQRKLKSFLSMQVYAWTVSQLCIFGIWRMTCFIAAGTNQVKPKFHQHREACGIASCRAHERRIKTKLQPSTRVLNFFHIDNVPANVKIFRVHEFQFLLGKICVAHSVDHSFTLFLCCTLSIVVEFPPASPRRYSKYR